MTQKLRYGLHVTRPRLTSNHQSESTNPDEHTNQYAILRTQVACDCKENYQRGYEQDRMDELDSRPAASLDNVPIGAYRACGYAGGHDEDSYRKTAQA